MNLKAQICSYVDERQNLVIEVNDKIWDYSEAGLREYKSAALLKALLEKEGFSIKSGISGMETAFSASFSTGDGPVIALLAEYDALPELSQEAGIPEKRARAGSSYGHGCGHNCIASGTFAAALAAKKFLVESGTKGTIRLYGCPGEENYYGKVYMCRDGAFDDVDAALTWHPADVNMVNGISTTAVQSVIFRFKGQSAHAAASPHLGRSALDACELMNVGSNYLREHVPPDIRIHYAYLDAGGSAPNVVQSHAALHYLIRARKITGANAVLERVKDIAKGAALMTGTAVEFETASAINDVLPVKSLNLIMQEALEEIGPPPFEQEDFALAQKYCAVLDQPSQAGAFMEGILSSEELKKMTAGQGLNTAIIPYRHSPESCAFSSTDVGDVSYCAPTAQLLMASLCMGSVLHSWQAAGQSATSIAHKASMTAGKVLALTAAKLYHSPEKLTEIKKDFTQLNPGKYICPLPEGQKPEAPKTK